MERANWIGFAETNASTGVTKKIILQIDTNCLPVPRHIIYQITKLSAYEGRIMTATAPLRQFEDKASPQRPSREALLARVPGLVQQIETDAVRRDLERELPFEAFRLFKEAGLGTLRIPVALGGPGGSVADYIEVIAAIGSADSHVAHAVRSHFSFTESLVLNPDGPRAREHLAHVLEGKLFGGAHTEQGGTQAGGISTRLTRTPD